MWKHSFRVCLIMASILGCVTTVCAQNGGRSQPYSVAALDGEFALVGAYTAGIARQLGVVRFDGGKLLGYLRVNVPGPTPTQRLVVPISFTGTTAVAEDGTGTANLQVVYPDRSLHVATLDILITDVRYDKGSKVATRVEYMQRETPELSPGALIVGTLIRRQE